jgi:site-specific DNA-cytosine methylase
MPLGCPSRRCWCTTYRRDCGLAACTRVWCSDHSSPSRARSPFDWPAKTIKAGVHGVSGGEAMIRFDDRSLRYFTVREAARMQGFRDDEFPVARSRSMGAIGNAVAAPLAELLTRQLATLGQ